MQDTVDLIDRAGTTSSRVERRATTTSFSTGGAAAPPRQTDLATDALTWTGSLRAWRPLAVVGIKGASSDREAVVCRVGVESAAHYHRTLMARLRAEAVVVVE
jgi:hypothetical protein